MAAATPSSVTRRAAIAAASERAPAARTLAARLVTEDGVAAAITRLEKSSHY